MTAEDHKFSQPVENDIMKTIMKTFHHIISFYENSSYLIGHYFGILSVEKNTRMACNSYIRSSMVI